MKKNKIISISIIAFQQKDKKIARKCSYPLSQFEIMLYVHIIFLVMNLLVSGTFLVQSLSSKGHSHFLKKLLSIQTGKSLRHEWRGTCDLVSLVLLYLMEMNCCTVLFSTKRLVVNNISLCLIWNLGWQSWPRIWKVSWSQGPGDATIWAKSKCWK